MKFPAATSSQALIITKNFFYTLSAIVQWLHESSKRENEEEKKTNVKDQTAKLLMRQEISLKNEKWQYTKETFSEAYVPQVIIIDDNNNNDRSRHYMAFVI